MNRVMTVANGWNVVIQTRKPFEQDKNTRRQLWVFDQTSKTIKSLDARDKERSLDFRGGSTYAYKTDSRWY